MTRLADLFQRYRRWCVLTGAGISTASGIPAYRDADGQWQQRKPVQYQEFVQQAKARQRYWARSMIGWPRIALARANAAHHALARLERAGRVGQLITQNVDGLHQRAGCRRVIDLHGRLDSVECLHCHYRMMRQAVQRWLETHNRDWVGSTAATAPDGDVDLETADFARFAVPPCPRCGGLLKPSVVFFGENVPRLRVTNALQRLADCDGLLVVGSSLMVFSGYRFCRAALAAGQPIVAINRGRTRADPELSLKIEADCGETLGRLATDFAP